MNAAPLKEHLAPPPRVWERLRAWASAARRPKPQVAITATRPFDAGHERLRQRLARELKLYAQPTGGALSISEACRLAATHPAMVGGNALSDRQIQEGNRLCRKHCQDGAASIASPAEAADDSRLLGWMPSLSPLCNAWLWTVSPIYATGTNPDVIASAGIANSLEMALAGVSAFLETP